MPQQMLHSTIFAFVLSDTDRYHLPSLFHCFCLRLKSTFSENFILHLSLFLSVRLISWL